MIDFISAVTDKVLDDVRAWQNRPLDECYLVVDRRPGGQGPRRWLVRNRPTYLVLGPKAIDRSVTETLAIVPPDAEHHPERRPHPRPVFDDTERWLSGSVCPEPDHLVSAFFGVLPALAELRCALVVVVHGHYLTSEAARRDIGRTLEIRIEVPALDAPASHARSSTASPTPRPRSRR